MSRLKRKKKISYNKKKIEFSNIKKRKKILKWEHPKLKEKCENVFVKQEGEELYNSLKDTLEACENGVGLAASQIGITKRAFVIRQEGEFKAYFNPEIIDCSHNSIVTREGCLSFPGQYFKIERPSKVTVRYTDLNDEEVNEELHGMDSVIFCHEYDHTMGICKVGERYFDKKKNKIR